jgi:hypothetical protein
MLADANYSAALFRMGIVLAALMAACIVCLAVAMAMRKRLKDNEPPHAEVGFTLSDLRQLHRTGKLSTEEFERAKGKIVAAARRNMPQGVKAKPGADLPLDRPQPDGQDADGAEG